MGGGGGGGKLGVIPKTKQIPTAHNRKPITAIYYNFVSKLNKTKKEQTHY